MIYTSKLRLQVLDQGTREISRLQVLDQGTREISRFGALCCAEH